MLKIIFEFDNNKKKIMTKFYEKKKIRLFLYIKFFKVIKSNIWDRVTN
jgi:hypothetical protein